MGMVGPNPWSSLFQLAHYYAKPAFASLGRG
ncbi:hypothetical protein F441_22786 [Phytophthora nicotianae CJ01A1]|uniref:Uncharacterized protein n=3 Tax=Phytophthora nicotianae TaxID=4792 RepID=W2YKV4_PHYNI|nr:hypothetical protein F444_16628 [Phytophthora nicotianae P1976]ETO99791.1 hypothetical protein F441_22786 [Phytophthora nicotianae CJ01A1]ETP35298.1 hypothetical protein F442_16474 [Phytophthora nicotianae P10297]